MSTHQSNYNKIKKAVFPVGGLGTRFLPATKAMPKEMLPVAAKPIIQHAFEEALEAGIEQFIFVTGRNKNAIENHFDHSYELQNALNVKEDKILLDKVKGWLPKAGQVAFIRQQYPLGLGHAVWCARNFIHKEPFVVILADEMLNYDGGFLTEMVKNYNEHNLHNLIAVTEVNPKDVKNYGIISYSNFSNGITKINGMVEKPSVNEAPSNYAIIGRYILSYEIFNYLENTNPAPNKEIQLTNAMNVMLHNGHNFHAFNHTGKRFDCGNQLGYLAANIAYTKRDAEDPDAIDIMLKEMLNTI